MRPCPTPRSRTIDPARTFATDRSGAVAIEYALIGVLVGIAIIAGASTLGSTVNARLQSQADAVNTLPAR